jgi:Zn-dependent M16 (insulinase) family peptidase
MTELHGFKLLEERDIAEINAHTRLFKHIQTGAELLSIENDDENKSFMVAFRTPPSDDTGLPHIMEHSVLNGSRKYPVKDPFVQLLKTSVNTFLNAMTFDDMTVYPVASTNLQDFYNLVDVYLDATFFPLISEETLMQEGWHYEAEGEESKLNFKGVVFNEMKAAYSTPERYLSLIANRQMWSTAPYKYSAGGLPAAITDLSYQQFKNFHETYYHPSNARFVFSGDDNPEERLRIVNEVLCQFDYKDVKSEIALETPRKQPVVHTAGYDAGDNPNAKAMIQMSWLLPETSNLELALELAVLSYALVSSNAAPLRKALMDSGLGEGLLGGGLNTYSRQATFSTGLKGIKEEDAPQIESLILETLGNLAEEGIDKETIKAAVNTFEFQLRERNYGSFPRGLATAISAMPPWLYGANPLDTLSFEADLAKLKGKMEADPELFEKLIGQYLLDNAHRTTVVLRPDAEVGKERDKVEREKLDTKREGLNADGLKNILSTQESLLKLQHTPDSAEELAKIPTLRLVDLERTIKTVEQEIIEQDGARIYFHNQPTSGIVYFDMAFNLRTLAPEMLPWVELFGETLTKIGTESEDFVKLAQRIGSKTGGVGASTMTTNLRDGSDYLALFSVRGKTMAEQSQDLLDIFRDILLTVKLDNKERFKQIILQRKTNMERNLALSGHAIAGGRTRAHFNLPAWADEQMSGTVHLFFLRELVDKIDNDWASVLASLESVRKSIINRNGLLVNVTMEDDKFPDFKARLDAFLAQVPKRDEANANWSIDSSIAYEALTLPAQVNFNAKSANLYQHGYKLHGSMSVITKHVSREYMWQNIRVLGGAYGGNMGFSPNTGLVSFLSWRDPNIVKTMETFTNAASYLQNLDMSEDELEKAIIGAVGDLDAYDLPDAKGYKAFLRHITGYSDAERQQYREEVFSTSLADFHHFGDVLAKVGEDARLAVVGSPDAIDKAEAELGVNFTRTKLQ